MICTFNKMIKLCFRRHNSNGKDIVIYWDQSLNSRFSTYSS